jgi:O-antigen/teichoic acid export membrane protein
LTFIHLIVGFIATPLLLRYLGSERFGLWRAIEVTLTFVNLIPQAAVQASGILLIPILANGDVLRFRQFVGGVLLAGSCLVLLSNLLALVGLPWFLWLVPAPSHLQEEQKVAWCLVLILTLPYTPFLFLRPALEAGQRGYWVNWGIMLQGLVFTGLAIVMATMSTGLFGQAVAMIVSQALLALVFLVITYRLWGWIIGCPNKNDIYTLMRHTINIVGLNILGGLAARIETLLVNYYCGSNVTTEYILGQRLFTIYISIIYTIGNSLWAPLANIIHTADHKYIIQHLNLSIKFTLWLGLAGNVVIFAADPYFLKLWVGDGYDPGPLTRIGFAVAFPALGVNVLLTWILLATNHLRSMYVISGGYFLVTCVAGIVLGSLYGAVGVAWGTAMGVLVAVGLSTISICKIFGLSIVELMVHIILLLIFSFLYAMIYYHISVIIEVWNWFSLILLLGIGWTVYLGLSWFLIFSIAEWREILGRVWHHLGGGVG